MIKCMKKIFILLLLNIASFTYGQALAPIEIINYSHSQNSQEYIYYGNPTNLECEDAIYPRWEQTALQRGSSSTYRIHSSGNLLRTQGEDNDLYIIPQEDRAAFYAPFRDPATGFVNRDDTSVSPNVNFCNSAPLDAEIKHLVTRNVVYFYIDYGRDERYRLQDNGNTEIQVRSSGHTRTGIDTGTAGKVRWIRFDSGTPGSGRISVSVDLRDRDGRTFNLWHHIDRADIRTGNNESNFPENYWRTDDVDDYVDYEERGIRWTFTVINPNNRFDNSHKWWSDKSEYGLFAWAEGKDGVEMQITRTRTDTDENEHGSEQTFRGGEIRYRYSDFTGTIRLRNFMTNTRDGITYAREFSYTENAEGLYVKTRNFEEQYKTGAVWINRRSVFRYSHQVALNSSGAGQAGVAVAYHSTSSSHGGTYLLNDSNRTNNNTGVDSWYQTSYSIDEELVFASSVVHTLTKGSLWGRWQVTIAGSSDSTIVFPTTTRERF